MSKQRNMIVRQTVLLEGWSRVIRVEYIQNRRDGAQERQERDLLNRGDSVAVLLYNRDRSTVLLLKQPRIVATLRGDAVGETIETCRGQVGDEPPSTCALREAEEEAGHRPEHLELIASVYPCPGTSLEVCYIFAGEYGDHTRVSPGGGLHHEGEDIEVLEVDFDQALDWVRQGLITDAGSIIALQSMALSGGLQPGAPRARR